MSAGSSISGIGGLFYMVMLIVGMCFKSGKILKDAGVYYATILVISFTLFMGLLSILFVYGANDMHW